jgi:hypothetical protein
MRMVQSVIEKSGAEHPPVAAARNEKGDLIMNGFWKTVLITAAAVAVVAMLPDIKRYIRISTM